MKDTFRDTVKEFILDNPGVKHSGIADLVLASGRINRSHRTLRLYVAEVQKMLDNGELTTTIHPDVDLDQDTTNVKHCDDACCDSKGFTALDNHPGAGEILELDGAITQSEDPGPQSEDGYGAKQEIEEEQDATTLDLEENEKDVEEEDETIFSSDDYDIVREFGQLCYRLKYSSAYHNIPVELVDKTFLAHSRSGLSLTEQQTIRLLAITDIDFKSMKARIGLSKDAAAVGPYVEEINTPEEVFALIGAYTTQLLEELPEVDDPVRSSLIRETRKQLVLAQNRNIAFNSFINELKDHVSSIDISKMVAIPNPDIEDEVTIVLADLHMGVVSDIYNTSIIEEKLAGVLSDIEDMADIRVNVVFPGDIMHNISGFMHADTWKNTEQGMWGAEAIIKPYEILYNFLIGISNLQAVYIVGGNHDRMNGNWKEEKTAEGAKLLAYMFSSTLPKHIKVEFDPRMLKFETKGLRIITQHGDLKADKKSKVEEVVWEHGSPDKFNLVLNAHHHTRITARGDDSHRTRRTSVPAFSPSDSYAKDCGYSNNPGYLIICERDGNPIVVDMPIRY